MNATMGEFLKPEGFDGPRGLRALSREGSAVVEAGRALRRTRDDRRTRRAQPYAGPHTAAGLEPLLLVPGFLAGDYTLAAMHRWLRAAGFRTYKSRINVNVGCTREAADRLERRIERIAERRGRKVSIVGHSLGGMLARGLVTRRPDLINGIISMGSPVLAPGAVHATLVWDAQLLTRLAGAGFGGLMAGECIGGECARASFEESQAPLPEGVDFTAIYSRREGIVDWRACLDPSATAVEVPTSHVGMAFDPIVFDAVRRALVEHGFSRARRAGDQSAAVDWRPASST